MQSALRLFDRVCVCVCPLTLNVFMHVSALVNEEDVNDERVLPLLPCLLRSEMDGTCST